MQLETASDKLADEKPDSPLLLPLLPQTRSYMAPDMFPSSPSFAPLKIGETDRLKYKYNGITYHLLTKYYTLADAA